MYNSICQKYLIKFHMLRRRWYVCICVLTRGIKDKLRSLGLYLKLITRPMLLIKIDRRVNKTENVFLISQTWLRRTCGDFNGTTQRKKCMKTTTKIIYNYKGPLEET